MTAVAPETCPNCGEDLPRSAKVCPHCGSDESTGWSEDARTGGLDLPDESFDYEDFTRREFGAPSPKPRGIRWFWWVAALVLAGLLVLGWLM